ncbi:hypothetical protein E2C01_028024 [Portunus trituberculatus]|uniref:Uncharacterized protein n=1 Tax=Portunus trituberculatus TaxID=210409 RepID=A0A5B7EMT3_PORTR|nr:hypothetical protein [Portunus trituberculatus]
MKGNLWEENVNVKGKGGTHQVRDCMRIGCMNVRRWNIGKFKYVSKELNEWHFDLVRVTKTPEG